MVGREAELLGGGLSSYLQFLKDGGCFEWEKELWVQSWTGLAGGGWVFLWVLWRGWASKQEAAILPDCAAFE